MVDQHISKRQNTVAAEALLAVSGGLTQLLGGALVIGSAMFADRAVFCALAGSGLILAGVLIAKRQRAGAWVFLAVFAITLSWSLHNIQSGDTSLAMRLIGPTILLGMIAMLMPALRGWRAKQTITAFTTMFAGMIGLGICAVSGVPLAWPTTTVVQLLAE